MSGVVYGASDSEESANAQQGVSQGEFGRDSMSLPTKQTLNPFFMEFVDFTTPSLQGYQDATVNYDGSGGSTKRQRANDWATMYYQNAYNTALLNYQNEYNSPLQQMLRYQEAGLSPWLVSDPGNMGGAPSAAAARGSNDPAPNEVDIANAAVSGVNAVNNTLKTAQGIYDYVSYGRPLNQFNLDTAGVQNQTAYLNAEIARASALAKDAEAAWSQYWNLGQDTEGFRVSESPRAKYMSESTSRISAQVDQLKALVDVLYPSQASANDARAALTLYQKQVLQGQKDAILQLDTGNHTADAILKMVCFWLLSK